MTGPAHLLGSEPGPNPSGSAHCRRLMYQGDPPPGAFDRSLAAEDDVRRLVGLAKSKHRRLTRLFSGDAVNFCDCPRLD